MGSREWEVPGSSPLISNSQRVAFPHGRAVIICLAGNAYTPLRHCAIPPERSSPSGSLASPLPLPSRRREKGVMRGIFCPIFLGDFLPVGSGNPAKAIFPPGRAMGNGSGAGLGRCRGRLLCASAEFHTSLREWESVEIACSVGVLTRAFSLDSEVGPRFKGPRLGSDGTTRTVLARVGTPTLQRAKRGTERSPPQA